MEISSRGKLLALVGAAVLVVSACGGAGGETTPDPTALATTTTVAAAQEMDAGASMDETMGMEAGEHEHDEAPNAIAWDGPEAPTVRVTVTGDPESGWDIAAEVTGFTFSNPARLDHTPGEGHTHVYVDGRLISMSYEPVVHVAALEPGEHQATVTLSRNDHTDYSIDDELIEAVATFIVPGDVQAADLSITATYLNGEISGVEGRPRAAIDDNIEITLHSDVADMVHVHGYDLFLELEAGETDTITFVADIPGIFEVEFEDSGALLFEIQVG